MVKVIWTLQAVKDLENIAEFIARDSSKYARLTVQNIRVKTKKLKEKSFLGRVVPEAGITEIR
jgi:toxin ParE1/3/4